MNVTPLMGAFPVSNAMALRVRVAPTLSVALGGATMTLATSGAGGVAPLSLQAPKVFAPSDQTPAALRASGSSGRSMTIAADRTPSPGCAALLAISRMSGRDGMVIS